MKDKLTYASLNGMNVGDTGRGGFDGLEFDIDHNGNILGRMCSMSDWLSNGETKEKARQMVDSDRKNRAGWKVEVKGMKKLIKAWNGWKDSFGVMAEGETGHKPKTARAFETMLQTVNHEDMQALCHGHQPVFQSHVDGSVRVYVR